MTLKKWKRLATNQLLDHPRLSVYEDEVELPNGVRTKYLRFESVSDSAMILARNTKNEFLVQKEYSYPPDEWLFQLPGGAIEPGEDPATGAFRELSEEAGLAGSLEHLGWFYVHNRRSDQKMHIYLATDLLPTDAKPDLEESFENHWFGEQEIDDMIASGEIRNYTLLAGWVKYKTWYAKR